MTHADATRAYAAAYAKAYGELTDPSDAIWAHAMGILIPETPLSAMEPARPVVPDNRTSNENQPCNHDGCVMRWMQERDAREWAERAARDWSEAANDWCNQAERARKKVRTLSWLAWVACLTVFAMGLAWWIRGGF